MARISIVHSTEYAYRNPVGLMRHRLMLRPDDSHDLRLNHATLDVDPKPSLVHWTHDAFDNSICFVEWPEQLRTKRLSIVSTLDLTHHPDGPPLPVYSLDPGAEAFPFTYAPDELPDLVSLIERQEPDPDGTVAAWARRFVGTKGESRTLAVLETMTHAIKADFRYGARREEGTQKAAETLALGSGTCRDFAVLMMEALRSFGVATRFVTGYLYDDTSGTTRGGGSTHAWCNVYLPGAGWMDSARSGHHLDEVSKTQFVPRIPAHTENDDLPVEMTALEKFIKLSMPTRFIAELLGRQICLASDLVGVDLLPARL